MGGYIKKWNVDDIYRQINSAYYICSDSRQDGFTAWGVKQDLYQMKWHLDEMLDKCPTFVDEEEWIKEQEKYKMWRTLKGSK
jgi:hypothetical protein